MALTISEVAMTARAGHVGASDVRIRDRGETTTEITGFGKAREVLVRNHDRVIAVVNGHGRGRDAEIEFIRNEPDGPWTYAIEVPEGTDVPADVRLTGVLNGAGDVVRTIHAARRALGLQPPRGTTRTSRLATFDPDYTALNG